MRPIIIVLAVGVAAAGLTGFLAKLWLDRQALVPASAPAPASLDVLVAARDLPAGTVIASGDLRYEPWPSSSASARLMIRGPGEDPKAQAVGQVARRPLAEGEPFTMAATFRQDGAGVLAGILAPGMRAFSIAVTGPTAVSGFVTPGDRVDVLLATDVNRTVEAAERKSGGERMLRYAAETVLEDIKVLAVDQQMTRSHDGSPILGKAVTLEVTAKQAEVLTAAGQIGNLQLSLRALPPTEPATQTAEASPPDFTADTDASRALQALGDARRKPAAATRGAPSGILVNRAGKITSEGYGR